MSLLPIIIWLNIFALLSRKPRGAAGSRQAVAPGFQPGTRQKRRKIAAIGKARAKEQYPEGTKRGEATKDKVVAGKDMDMKRWAAGLAAAFWTGAAAAQDSMA